MAEMAPGVMLVVARCPCCDHTIDLGVHTTYGGSTYGGSSPHAIELLLTIDVEDQAELAGHVATHYE